jgi:SAM-dependent methyltransferase
MNSQDIATCPICHGSDRVSFLEIKQLPLYCNLLWPDQEAAINCQRGDIHLSICSQCGFIWNSSFDPKVLIYSQTYENSLHYSRQFQAYADLLAQRLVEKYQLYGKKIIEIGCGKGDFLASLCQLGGNSGVGFDKSYVPNKCHSELELTFVQDFFGEKYSFYQSDFICCRQVLEHIEKPLDFLRMIKQVSARKHPVQTFFEVPNAAFVFEHLSVWDIIYEHCNYFSCLSLKYLFQKAGYLVQGVAEEFDGQFLSIEAIASTQVTNVPAADPDELADLVNFLAGFRSKFEEKILACNSHLARFRQQNQRVAIWGAGSKGVTFLNLLESRDVVTCAVDINPQKQGKFVPGTGHPIVAPEALQREPVDVVMVMNPIYESEIRASLADVGLYPDFWGL